MCQTTISGIDDMDEISSTSQKKTGKFIEPRKIRKPLMEKKRRARINQSLDELKRIVVDAEKLTGQDLQSRVNKLEKADILEMTVRYLKRKVTPRPSVPDVYLAGYRQCMEQVQELLAEQWTEERRQKSGQRMVEHLEACVQRLNVPPLPNNHLLSSDKSIKLTTTTKVHSLPGPVRNSSSSSFTSSSDDDDSVEEELITTVGAHHAATVRPSPNRHTTEYQDTPTKSMWRPW